MKRGFTEASVKPRMKKRGFIEASVKSGIKLDFIEASVKPREGGVVSPGPL